MSARFPSDPEPPPKVGGRGSRYNGLLVLGIALFAATSIYAAIAVSTQLDDFFLPGNELQTGALGNLPGIDGGENPDAANLQQRINILVMGLDRRLDEPKDLATRTDTMFVLTVDPFSKTGGIFSIPRDLLVEIPNGRGGYFKERINVAYEVGEREISYPGGGGALAVDTVEHNFKMPIDHYMILDFTNFIGIIDELGGIDIDVPEALYDPQYEDCTTCELQEVIFDPGPQQMDGRTALAYARIRYGSDDLQRIERQQLVMRATAEKAASINFLAAKKLLSLYDKYKAAVKSDFSDFRLPGMAKLAGQIPIQRIQMISLKDAITYCSNCEAAYLLPNWDKIDQLTRQFFLDGVVLKEGALIEIQNGTDLPGLSSEVAEKLTYQGLPPELLSLADNPATDISQTLIYNRNGKHYTAFKLAEWLGLDPNQVISDPRLAPQPVNGPADIVIVAGLDSTLVSAALP